MVEAINIYKTFNKGSLNEVNALSDISVKIEQGEFVTIIGTNGSGKSTFLNAIAGNFILDSGKILIKGNDLTKKLDYQRAKYLSRVFQNPYMGTAANMTILENIHTAFMRGKIKLPIKKLDSEKVNFYKEHLNLLEMQLEDRIYNTIGSLSGGQRQAITLLMAVITKPDVLLLDEHTAALDPKSANQIIFLTRKFVEKFNLTTIMVTHSMQQAIEFGNRIIMMHKGKIIDDIKNSEKKYLTADDLLNKFSEIRKQEKLDDILLEEFRKGY